MNSKVVEIPVKPKKASRPSLYTEHSSNPPVDIQDSILGSLESTGSQRSIRKTLLLVALALGLLGSGWYAMQAQPNAWRMQSTLASAEMPSAKPDAESTALLASNDAAAPISTVAGNAATQAEQAPAIIVADTTTTEPLPQDKLALASVPLTQEPATGSKDERASDAVTKSELAQTLERKQKDQEEKAVLVPSASTALASVSPKSQAAPANAKAVSASAGKAAKAGKPAKDDDVELIAALLNRVTTKPAQTERDVTRTSEAGKAQPRTSSQSVKKAKKNDGTRAAAVSRVNEPTETLLKRCKSMGFFEGELCRFRTCSGRWDSDPACMDTTQLSTIIP